MRLTLRKAWMISEKFLLLVIEISNSSWFHKKPLRRYPYHWYIRVNVIAGEVTLRFCFRLPAKHYIRDTVSSCLPLLYYVMFEKYLMKNRSFHVTCFCFWNLFITILRAKEITCSWLKHNEITRVSPSHAVSGACVAVFKCTQNFANIKLISSQLSLSALRFD